MTATSSETKQLTVKALRSLLDRQSDDALVFLESADSVSICTGIEDDQSRQLRREPIPVGSILLTCD